MTLELTEQEKENWYRHMNRYSNKGARGRRMSESKIHMVLYDYNKHKSVNHAAKYAGMSYETAKSILRDYGFRE